MTVKTLADCAGCGVVSLCDAHVSNGEWKHRKGVDPCEVRLSPLIDAELANKALDLRRQAEAIEPGFNAEEWLRERGL